MKTYLVTRNTIKDDNGNPVEEGEKTLLSKELAKKYSHRVREVEPIEEPNELDEVERPGIDEES